MKTCHHSRHCRNRLRHFRHFSGHTVRLLPEVSTIYSRAGLWHGSCTCSVAEGNMFRISTIDTPTKDKPSERRLVVEGTLVHPWVDELRKTWSSAGNSLEGRTLVIDLTNVTVISREGESAIFDLMKEGATFACGGIHTRHLLRELAHRCHTKVNQVLKRSKG